MVIKNITYTTNPDTGIPVPGSGKPLTRAYFNKLGKTLMPGQATNVAATVSVTDVLTDLTFLRDLALLKDETFATAAWAGYHTHVPLGGSAETSPNRLKLVDHVLAYDGTYFKNPISGTASNPSAAQIQVFLSVAEKAYLTNLLAAAKDLYVPVAGFKFTPETGVAADSIYLGSTGIGSFGDFTFAKSAGDVWSITVVDGPADIISRKYLGPTNASPVGANYTSTCTIAEVVAEPVVDYAFTFSDATNVLKTVAAVSAALNADGTEFTIAPGHLLRRVAVDEYELEIYGVVYTGATAVVGTYTHVIGDVTAVTQFAVNPDSVSEVIGAAPVIVPTPQAVSEPEIMVEAKAVEPAVVSTVADLPKPKKAKGKSIADLEAANKA